MASRKSAAGGPGPAPATDDPEAFSFEVALERLETLVEELESGSLTLEESIARYEEGVRLSRRLTRTLDEAEQRIERLVEAEQSGEPPTTTPMELDLRNSGPGAGEEPAF